MLPFAVPEIGGRGNCRYRFRPQHKAAPSLLLALRALGLATTDFATLSR